MEKQGTVKRALPEGYILCGKYRIDKVIGEGGFGITYSGIRLDDELRVAIKEYFPSQYASREEGEKSPCLHIFCGDKSVQFDKGISRFRHESDILKEYSYLEGIVSVIDTCDANNTSYIIMKYVEGITLARYIRENGAFRYDELVRLMTPLIKALAQIHRQGVIHRDISPENIQIGLDNRFYLLDFGAAREIYGKSRQKTVIFKHGYAPPEQYTEDGSQGAWTDVYGLAATMYTALSGEPLEDAVLRMQSSAPDADIDILKGITDWQKEALKKGLALKTAERYQNMETFLIALTVPPAIEERKTQVTEKPASVKRENTASRKIKSAICIAIIVLVAFAVAAALRILKSHGARTEENAALSETEKTSPSHKEADTKEPDAKEAYTQQEEDTGKVDNAESNTTENNVITNIEIVTGSFRYDDTGSDTGRSVTDSSNYKDESAGDSAAEQPPVPEKKDTQSTTEDKDSGSSSDDFFDVIEESGYEEITLE